MRKSNHTILGGAWTGGLYWHRLGSRRVNYKRGDRYGYLGFRLVRRVSLLEHLILGFKEVGHGG